MDKDFKLVPASNVHQSSILPQRQHNEELSHSVKKLGIQQPVIVRSIPGKTGEYEVIDGRGRRESVKDNEQILVDVRCDVTDSDAFEISHATFQRRDRTAYETALFYAAWLKALEKDQGPAEGLQQKLASLANLHESSLSQYLAINGLFEKLRTIVPNEPFNKLKTWNVNKLYKLSELSDDPHLADVAQLFELKFDVSIDEIEEAVNSYLGKDRAQELWPDGLDLTSESEEPQTPLGPPSASPSSESSRVCLRNAKKVGSLATETHNILDGLVQELVQNAEQFSSSEICRYSAASSTHFGNSKDTPPT
jgi:ParB/RepB/Spo0J family partition protein